VAETGAEEGFAVPHWRKASWTLVIWNVLMLLWVVSGTAGLSSNCAGRTGDALAACQAGTAIGAGIGVTLIAMIWFFGFVVLALVWLMSRPSRRLCPRCGNEVKKGLTVCPSCQYEFGVVPAV
jgi:hypothetical protein